jgi:hypothetical protein
MDRLVLFPSKPEKLLINIDDAQVPYIAQTRTSFESYLAPSWRLLPLPEFERFTD